MYKQKDIILVPFPFSDLSGNKQRPAIIISNNKINKTEDKICCLITSNKPINGLLITKNSFESGDLSFKSWVKPHRIFTVNEKIIKRKLCVLNDEFHDKIISHIQEGIKRENSIV